MRYPYLARLNLRFTCNGRISVPDCPNFCKTASADSGGLSAGDLVKVSRRILSGDFAARSATRFGRGFGRGFHPESVADLIRDRAGGRGLGRGLLPDVVADSVADLIPAGVLS